jgi:phospholipase/lecithinase/hemolysin
MIRSAPRFALPTSYFLISTLRASALVAVVCLSLVRHAAFAQQSPPSFSQIVVFGDSYSDIGNIRARVIAKTGGMVDFPSHSYNYATGRYTNDDATVPASTTYAGLWDEQLAATFLNIPPATYSLGGGTDYAFGGATTKDGTRRWRSSPRHPVTLRLRLITWANSWTIISPPTWLTPTPSTFSGVALTISCRMTVPRV